MKLLAKITLRSLKLNRWRTIATILAIFLSTVILVSVTTLASTTMASLKEREISSSGNWHVLYQGVAGNNVSTLQEDERSKETAVVQAIGYLQGEIYNTRQPYFYLCALNQEGFDVLSYNLLDGRYPKTSHEIIIPHSLTTNKTFDYQIYDTIRATHGNRLTSDTKEALYQNSSYDPTKEFFQPLQEETYTIVGIYDDSYTTHYQSAGYPIVCAIEEFIPTATYDVYVQDTQINQSIYAHAQQLSEQIDSDSLSYNTYLLLYEGIAGDTQLVFMVRLLTGCVCLLIMVSSIIVIHNSFSISLSQRTRYLGMLASVGATKRQKQLSVFLEALFLSVPTIFLASITSLFATALSLRFIETSFASLLEGLPLIFSIDPALFCLSIALAFFTVWFSAWRTAKHAGKISSIDAIRQSQDILIKTQAVKTSSIITRSFGICASLGLKNQKRFRSRYISILSSLTLSFVLFVSIFSLSSYFEKSMNMIAEQTPYDVMLQYDKRTVDQIKDTNGLFQLDQADEIIRTQTLNISYMDDVNFSPELKAYLEENGQIGINASIVSLDDQALADLCKQNGIADDVLAQETALLVNRGQMLTDSTQHTYAQISYLTDDVQTIVLEIGQDKQLTISIDEKIEDPHPLDPAAGMDFSSITLYVNEKYFAKIAEELETISTINLYFTCDDQTQLTQEIHTYLQSHDNMESYASIQNKQEYLTKSTSLLMLLRFFLYVFLLLVGAIAITNVCNTLVNSFTLRSQENAIYFSIGMEKRQFYKMLIFETVSYALKSIFYGLMIAVPLCYLFYQILGIKFRFGFYMPVEILFIASCALLTLSLLMLAYHFTLTKKQNVIETIRQESI